MTLKQMAERGEEFYVRTHRHPFFNYCVHEGNNKIEDVQRLVEIFDPRVFRATISVICEKDETVRDATDRQRKLADDFEYLMSMHGYDTKVFDPAGQDDIGGGCGQLFQVQRWAKENPEKVKKSIGALRDGN
jgi:23S rRNA (adenine2503-C2)-methyltransferase